MPGAPLDSTTNLSHFDAPAFPKWNHNWANDPEGAFLALWDKDVYNMFVDAANERFIASASCLNPTATTFASVILPHAAEGDYILGRPPALYSPPATNTANSKVGWAVLMTFLFDLDPLGILGGLGFPTGKAARCFEPSTNTAFAGFGGTGASHWFYANPTVLAPAAPAPGTGAAYLDGHISDYYVPHQYPREITNRTTSPIATAGAHARLIESSATAGTNSGCIFTSDGAAWNYDPTVALPDILSFNECPQSPFIGGAGATARSDVPLPGDYFHPSGTTAARTNLAGVFLQRLRDKINMTLGFFCEMGITWNSTTDLTDPTADPSYYIYGGYGTGTTLALANAACMASFGTSSGGVSTNGLFDVFGGVTTNNGWAAQGSVGGDYLVGAQKSCFRVTSDVALGATTPSVPTGNGSYACQLWFGVTFTCGTNVTNFDNTTDPTYGESIVDSYNNTAATDWSKATFVHTSPVIASSGTVYTSAPLFSPTFPDGSAGATAGWETDGSTYAVNNIITIFCVARYDVAGGFKYTKDYTGS